MDPSFDFIQGIQQAIRDFSAGWFLGISTLCYVVIQVFRGQAGFNIPFVSEWIENQSKEAKTYIILLFFALAGAFAAFASEKVTFLVVLDGFVKGLALGLGTNGARNAIKQGIDGTNLLAEKKEPQETK